MTADAKKPDKDNAVEETIEELLVVLMRLSGVTRPRRRRSTWSRGPTRATEARSSRSD